MFSVGLSRRALRWVGPKDHEAAFKRMMGSSLELDGDDLLMGWMPGDIAYDDAEKELRTMAKTRGIKWPKDFEVDMTLETLKSVSPPGMRLHGQQYIGIATDKKRTQNLPQNAAFFSDWNQDAFEGRSCYGSSWPVMLRNSFIVSHKEGRRVTSCEQIGAQGWHVHGLGGSHVFHNLIMKDFDDLNFSPGAVRALAGNGIHVGAWYAWMLFVLSNIMRVEDIESSCMWQMRRSMSWGAEASAILPRQRDDDTTDETKSMWKRRKVGMTTYDDFDSMVSEDRAREGTTPRSAGVIDLEEDVE